MPHLRLIYATFETEDRRTTIRVWTVFIYEADLEVTHLVIEIYLLGITEERDRVFVLSEHFCNCFSNPNCPFICMETQFNSLRLVLGKDNAHIDKNLSCPFHSIGTLFTMLIEMQFLDVFLLIWMQFLRYSALIKVFLNLRFYKCISLGLCQKDEGAYSDPRIFKLRLINLFFLLFIILVLILFLLFLRFIFFVIRL